ncbi:PadR family transcriptional regulator [Candidatus Parcubacteria bacterium]|nr:PadR family transcriptional regulator [Candidatus Parcubacteria bacterium]
MPRMQKPLSMTGYLIFTIIDRYADGAYGLQIVRDSCGVVKQGSIYVLLQGFENEGYVISKTIPRSPTEAGIAKRAYKLTEKGKRRLEATKQWLQAIQDTT